MPRAEPSVTSATSPRSSFRALFVTNMYPTPAAPDDGTPVADEVRALRALGWEVELLHVPREGGSRRVYLGLGGHVRSLAEKARPDVVVVMYGGVMADLVTRAVRDVPVVLTFRGTDLLGGRGRGIVHGLSRRYGVLASRRAAPRAEGIVVKSPNLLDALPAGVDRSRTWIVPDGVDLERFRPLDTAACRAELGWTPDRRHVLFPGSATRPEKRFALAQEAVALLAGEVELHALSGVRHDDVAIWLNAADAVLLTSAHEGSPNVVKEALACDVSVVSVDVGDVRERIAGLRGCALAEPTAADLAAKLEQVLDHGRPTAAREQVEDLSWNRVAEALSEIYSAAARGSPTASASRAA